MRWLPVILLVGLLLSPSLSAAGNDYPGAGTLGTPPSSECRDAVRSIAACLAVVDALLASPDGSGSDTAPTTQYQAGLGNSAQRPAALLPAPQSAGAALPSQLYVSGAQIVATPFLAGGIGNNLIVATATPVSIRFGTQ